MNSNQVMIVQTHVHPLFMHFHLCWYDIIYLQIHACALHKYRNWERAKCIFKFWDIKLLISNCENQEIIYHQKQRAKINLLTLNKEDSSDFIHYHLNYYILENNDAGNDTFLLNNHCLSSKNLISLKYFVFIFFT